MRHDTPLSRFGFVFSRTARRWRRELDLRLAGIGMADATWPPLVHLSLSGGGISQKDLAERVGIDGSSLVRLLDILSERGLLERRPDPGDRRSRQLYLTPAGKAAVRRIEEVLERTEHEMLEDLGHDDLMRLLEAMDRIDRRIARMQQEER
ncbi:transcriptional regulator [Haematobacter missouriensis]|uniref:Transcriptional regulator n=1 Tax=Haematobacter missouriensis TaxID=366616 RepID=A0A212AJ16_9RHOB|nr:MarR family transcriptional regulator [Haematobacter missouriensis]KFI32968.1 transcriptional regulator [Haematobacter missouriensis]OWJ74111.1 transcriptional regulator [Haematobacter missouriensis]OWJ81478.1 transcriptional regulator [Haematobacter missouriensis]